jgi:hypothetical protein
MEVENGGSGIQNILATYVAAVILILWLYVNVAK